jgi:hypothetical protein
MGVRLRVAWGPGRSEGGIVGAIVSLEEWRRRRRVHAQSEPAATVPDVGCGLGDEVVLRAWSDAIAGRAVEVHLLAATIVVSGGDVFF